MSDKTQLRFMALQLRIMKHILKGNGIDPVLASTVDMINETEEFVAELEKQLTDFHTPDVNPNLALDIDKAKRGEK